MNCRLANKIVNAVANESDKGRYSEGKIAAALRRVERTVESKLAEAYWWHAMSILRQAKREGGRGVSVYRLKPLEWRLRPQGTWIAETLFGTIHMDSLFGYPRWVHPDADGWRECESFDHGKQLAWEWYQSKMMEALEPVTPPP